MGEITKLYCELCKAEITPPTFSRPGENGEIHFSLALYRHEGMLGAAQHHFEICGACYDKVSSWANTKQKAAAKDWGIEPPATVNYNMPSV